MAQPSQTGIRWHTRPPPRHCSFLGCPPNAALCLQGVGQGAEAGAAADVFKIGETTMETLSTPEVRPATCTTRCTCIHTRHPLTPTPAAAAALPHPYPSTRALHPTRTPHLLPSTRTPSTHTPSTHPRTRTASLAALFPRALRRRYAACGRRRLRCSSASGRLR